MMSSSDGNRWFAPLLIVAIMVIVFGLFYYTSTDSYDERLRNWREDNTAATQAGRSTVTGDQIFLKKNEKIVVGRNGLIYKGLEDNTIILDLYLLDLDPEQAFTKRFAKKQAKKEMLLGEAKYRLLSVNEKYMSLKVIRTSYAP